MFFNSGLNCVFKLGLKVCLSNSPVLKPVTIPLLLGNTGGVFSIDNATGHIFIAKDLDLTNVGFYTLTVRVTDSGFPPLMATASARISLILSDFSNPKFSQKEYQAEVKTERMGAWGRGVGRER